MCKGGGGICPVGIKVFRGKLVVLPFNNCKNKSLGEQLSVNSYFKSINKTMRHSWLIERRDDLKKNSNHGT